MKAAGTPVKLPQTSALDAAVHTPLPSDASVAAAPNVSSTTAGRETLEFPLGNSIPWCVAAVHDTAVLLCRLSSHRLHALGQGATPVAAEGSGF
jgi:hypothetical protein